MPLPAALAARLARRGIIETEAAKEAQLADDEEVIAEDYDESGGTLEQNLMHNKHCSKLVTQDPSMGALGCPNKWNVYHECNDYCQQHWGWGRDPDPKLEVKRLRMLDKYPLPSTWVEVYDPGTGRFYYWHTESEMVSWLPPGHPRFKPGLCAAAVRSQMKAAEEEQRQDNQDGGSDGEDTRQDGQSEGGSSDGEDEDRSSRSENRSTRRRRRSRERSRSRERLRGDRDDSRGDRSRRERRPERRRRGGEEEDDTLDPMDPAAYSDVPRGNWTSGLERDVKTGVDSTVSGPLFQQRPYPSPGDVLRANSKR